MTSANLFDLMRASAPALEKAAIEASDGQSLTYGALFERSGRAANALAAIGVAPGDRVAVQIDKSPDMIVLLLACLRAGAVLLPLNPAYTMAELEYFLADARPALTLCRPAALETTRALAARLALPAVESLGAARDGGMAERIAAAPAEFATVPRVADDLAAILYTSGTTGRSKGAMLTHDNLSSNARALIDVWRFTSADVLIHALPVFHTHGLFTATNVALLSGATMIFQPRFDADAIVAALPRATSLMGVPTFYVRLAAHEGVTRASTAHIRLFVSGSAPLLAETHEAWRAKTGHAILERYGMTETNMITSNPYEGERRPGTVGFPLPGVRLRIVELRLADDVLLEELLAAAEVELRLLEPRLEDFELARVVDLHPCLRFFGAHEIAHVAQQLQASQRLAVRTPKFPSLVLKELPPQPGGL